MVAISCVSVISPAGNTPQSTAAALRARVPVFDELVYQEHGGEHVIGAMVADIPVETRGQERLAALAKLAFEKLPRDLIKRLPWKQMQLFVCMPERARPGPRHRAALGNFLPNGHAFGPAQTTEFEGGSTSTFEALSRARTMLSNSSLPACLIIAIDSLIDARVLSWLDKEHRLKTSQRSDGVIPGEAACLAIVTKQPITRTSVILKGLGLAHETATIVNEEPFLGKGLAAALRSALSDAGIGMHDVDIRMTDVAGESYAFEELVLALTRVMRQVRDSHTQPIWHPADCIGDCGAAAGLIQLAWIEQAFAKGYAPGKIAALHGSSTYGTRAVAIVGPSENGAST
jgi:3-oxoacyl-[acyl-carrier-protein] synthase I